MFEELQAKIDEVDNKRKQLNEELFTLIKQHIFSTLDKYPEFVGVRWTQYIPAFNDGEPCVFRVCEPSYLVEVDEDDDEGEWIEIDDSNYEVIDSYSFDYSWNGDSRVYKNAADKEKVELLRAIYSALQTVEDECQEQFGNNAEVIILHDRVIVNDYDCGY